jgi:hypothetical protein
MFFQHFKDSFSLTNQPEELPIILKRRVNARLSKQQRNNTGVFDSGINLRRTTLTHNT